ncbi:MAG: molybdopterin-guanine dinucleotide biosynthesis protein B [Acidobacteriota bacterium]|nr:molybdopterin-guanine dinucleotide biosynthesis protein B [Acidobacteriota bacterium]
MKNLAAPVLTICGYSGAGKTTLIEQLIPALIARGLQVAVVKHDAHGFKVDKPGKDSDRFFQAGATVMLRGPGEQFERRGAHAELSLQAALARLSQDHDILLVEGHKGTPFEKIWLESEHDAAVPEGVTGVLQTLPWNGDRLAALLRYVDEWLPRAWRERTLLGGMLMGGHSSRMGEPKQLMLFHGRSMGEIVATALSSAAGEGNVVALGAGPLPAMLENLPRLADAREWSGPVAAIFAAHRWAPGAAWIFCACDHPNVAEKHVRWLLEQRRPGRWAVIPRQEDGYPAPMLALYEPQALAALTRRAMVEENASPRWLLRVPKVDSPDLPAELLTGWHNVNTREEWRKAEFDEPRKTASEENC